MAICFAMEPNTSSAFLGLMEIFIFGLPDSGTPAAVSIMSSTVQGSGFFYDRTFGIEGSWMAIIVNIAACVVVALIGRRIHLSPKPEDG
ncbi:MAG: hypothetical protein IJI20_00085 [Firmicutes bacterium]|nr:hypothetical protein [Bacillota bacterium]